MNIAQPFPVNADLAFAATSDFLSSTWTWLPSPGAPVDLTGYTAVAIVFANFDDVAPLVSVTDVLSTDGQVLLGGIAGTVQLSLTHASTAVLPSDPLRWTLRLTAPDATQTVLLTGTVHRSPIGPLT